jgi:hypothetical protein
MLASGGPRDKLNAVFDGGPRIRTASEEARRQLYVKLAVVVPRPKPVK